MIKCIITRTKKTDIENKLPFGRCVLISDLIEDKPFIFYTLDKNNNIGTQFITSLVTSIKWTTLHSVVIHTMNSIYTIEVEGD